MTALLPALSLRPARAFSRAVRDSDCPALPPSSSLFSGDRPSSPPGGFPCYFCSLPSLTFTGLNDCVSASSGVKQ